MLTYFVLYFFYLVLPPKVLITELGSEDYQIRQLSEDTLTVLQAVSELETLGLTSSDLEVRTRAKRALDYIVSKLPGVTIRKFGMDEYERGCYEIYGFSFWGQDEQMTIRLYYDLMEQRDWKYSEIIKLNKHMIRKDSWLMSYRNQYDTSGCVIISDKENERLRKLVQ